MSGEGRLSGSVSAGSDPRFARVLEIAADGIIVIDEQANILTFSKSCEQMFGYGAAEVIGRSASLLLSGDEPGEDDRPPRACPATMLFGSRSNVHGRRKDGNLFPLSVSVGEADTPEGRQFIVVLQDLSTRPASEQQVNELRSDVIRLARIATLNEMGLALAHELNQPLTAIMLYLQAAHLELQGREIDGRAPTILEKARREAQRASAIIQRIRQLGEKRAPERQASDLNSIVEDAVELTQMGHDQAIYVIRDYQRDLPSVDVDQVQIQQVVVNLVRNAFEALQDRPGGEIVVSTGLDDRGLTFSVADNGPGIAPDRLGDLFEAFTTGKRSGMGLGLAISRTIVESHGGELLVDPGGRGEGARFMVRLPFSKSSGEPTVEERSRA